MSKSIENEEVKPIVLTDTETGTKYVLEFSRESVKFAEQRGFNINDVDRTPMTKIPELFYYSFRMHHRNISRERTDHILFDDMGGMPDGMLERLGMLYAVPFDALSNVSTDGEAKNSRVTVEL